MPEPLPSAISHVPSTQVVPPRLAHNKPHLDKFMAARGQPPLFPPVAEQLNTHVCQGLPPGSYNPSLVRYRGRLVMSYRFHETTAKTRLGLAELNENLNVISTQTLDLDETESCEDGKLFVFKNELHLNFVVSTWPEFPSSQVKNVMLAKPDHWRISDKDLYWISNRNTMEKNHVPLVHDETLEIIYSQAWPEDGSNWQIIYTPAMHRERKNPALRWPYGEVRGGTVPLRWQMPGRGPVLISFFHSRLDNALPPVFWRYFVGAVIRKATPEFEMLAISQRPILRGSEAGGDPSRFHHKKNVVFPLGVIGNDDGWLLSVGINDSQCALVSVKPEHLNL